MRHAHYEILADDNSFYGEIAACRGVFATGASLEECRRELEEVLQDWLLFRIHKNLPVPSIDGVSLRIRKVAAA
jgi:predicted RNase H-like HicB family nuclease